MNNWEMYNLTNYLINKEQTGNTFNPSEFQMVLNAKSKMFMRKLLGLPENYQMTPSAQWGYGKSTHINDSLKPFQKTKTLPVLLGNSTLPYDYYYHISSLFTRIDNDGCNIPKETNSLIELCSQGEFNTRKSGWYSAPDEDYPIMMFSNFSIKLLPKSIKSFELSYIKQPDDADIIYTINQDGTITYDEIYSTELDWMDSDKVILVSMILESVGLNLRSTEIVQTAQSMIQGGK